MMKMMVMNCFCSMIGWRLALWLAKAFSLISRREHCQRFSPSWISDTRQAGFEPAQKLSFGCVKWSYAVVITTAPVSQALSELYLTSQNLEWLHFRNVPKDIFAASLGLRSCKAVRGLGKMSQLFLVMHTFKNCGYLNPSENLSNCNIWRNTILNFQ